VVSLTYYGSVLQALFLDDSSPNEADAADGDSDEEARSGESPATGVVALTALAVVVLGLVPLFLGASSLILPFTVR